MEEFLFLSWVGFRVTFWSFFEQDIVFGAYLTLQAESREDVDVFKQKSWLTINRCCPTPYNELDGEAKKLDTQSHKLEVNNSVVSVQTVLCVPCTIYVTVSILCH